MCIWLAIYLSIFVLQGAESDGPSGATVSGSSGVVLPTSKKSKRRRRGVSSFRALSTRIQKWFHTEYAASDDNQSMFYNRSAESLRVQNAPEPYDFLRLSKTQSGTVKDPDQAVPPQSPHDYFTLEKETMDNIVEVEAEDNKSNENVVVDIEKHAEDDFEEVSETPKNYEYFIIEPTHGTIESPSTKASVKSKSSVKDNSAKPGDDTDTATKTETGGKGSSVKSAGSGKERPVPKPRSLGSPTAEDKDVLPNSSDSLKKKTEFETLSKSSEETPKNSCITLGDTLGTQRAEEDGKDEDYVITKLGDAPKPPVLEIDSEDREDYLVPSALKDKPDYVDVCPAPPPRTTSLTPNVSPAPSRTNSKYGTNAKEEYSLISDIHQIQAQKVLLNKIPKRAPTVPKHGIHALITNKVRIIS